MNNKPSLAVIALALCLHSQPAETPSFEVASVKFVTSSEVPDSASFSPLRSGRRFAWTTPLGPLVSYAFKLPPWQIKGAQLPTGFYAVEALTDESASQELVRVMVQRLLVERFALATHREKVAGDAYALVADKGGTRAATEAGPLPDYLKGKDPAAFEGRVIQSMEGHGISAITGRGVSFSQLGGLIAEDLRAPVIDRTGLDRKYYFAFTFRNDDAIDVDLPTLPTALREALGLRLVREKTETEVLVIDHVEKMPTEN